MITTSKYEFNFPIHSCPACHGTGQEWGYCPPSKEVDTMDWMAGKRQTSTTDVTVKGPSPCGVCAGCGLLKEKKPKETLKEKT